MIFMRKFFVAALVALASCGCATVHQADGTTRRYIMLQAGVIVRVINNCTPFLDLEQVSGVVVKGLSYGDSATVPLVPTVFSGSNRRIPLTAKGYTANLEYLGSITREFYVNSGGSHEEVWEIDRLNLPGNRGGCL